MTRQGRQERAGRERGGASGVQGTLLPLSEGLNFSRPIPVPQDLILGSRTRPAPTGTRRRSTVAKARCRTIPSAGQKCVRQAAMGDFHGLPGRQPWLMSGRSPSDVSGCTRRMAYFLMFARTMRPLVAQTPGATPRLGRHPSAEPNPCRDGRGLFSLQAGSTGRLYVAGEGGTTWLC